ncbi:MAG: EpsI family protein [Pseudomonadales bacterium]|nr:EpsI family protein [Pseudomonadales bacterium]
MSKLFNSQQSFKSHPIETRPTLSLLQMTIILALIFASLIIAYLPSALTLHEKWFMSGAGYSHGYLLLAICVYLIYDNEKRYRLAANGPNLIFALPLTGMSLTWMLLDLANIQSIQQLLMPFIFITACALVLGFRFALTLSPVIGFILFGMPVWNYLIPLLQAISVSAVGIGLDLINLPAYIEGINVTIPDGQFQIAGGCSGLSYLLVGLTLGTLYGFLSYQNLWKRFALIAITILLSLFSNWVRIISIIYAGHHSQMQSSLVADHGDFGWLVFAFTLVPIFIVAKKLEKGESETTAPAATAENIASSFSIPKFAIFMSFGLMLIAPILNKTVDTLDNKGNQQAFQFPLFLEEWQFIGHQKPTWLPNFQNADKIVTGSYRHNAFTVNIAVHHFFHQNQSRELIYYTNTILSEPWEERSIEIETNQSDTINKSLIIYNASNRKVINDKRLIYWFNVAGMRTTTKVDAKILQLRGLLHSRKDAALITINIDCDNRDCSISTQQLNSFSKIITPYIDNHFKTP